MKIYIQSKSGDYNATIELEATVLPRALQMLRNIGGYFSKTRGKTIFVPFEQIAWIVEAE